MEPASESTLEGLIRNYGRESNSFFALYPGFQTFRPSQGTGMVGYLKTPSAWVGVCEPFCEVKYSVEAMREYFDAARASKKAALFIPVGPDAAARARSAGFGVFQAGMEPFFELEVYQKRFPSWLDGVPQARQLSARGARVREVSAAEKEEPRFRAMIEEVLRDWLSSRKLPPLGFLNRVEPWAHASLKKLFVVEIGDRVVAFLSALPIWPSHGWYFVDLIRLSEAPVGTTELLVLEAMRLVYAQGAKWVSLGVAPLAGLDELEFGAMPMTRRILNWVFNRFDIFYGFKSLYDFKLKLHPTQLQEAYIIYPRDQSLWALSRALSQAYLPRGVLWATLSGIGRALAKWRPSAWIEKLLDPDAVVRALPVTLKEFFVRSRTSWFLMISWLAVFLGTPKSAKSVLWDHCAFSRVDILRAGFSKETLERLVFPSFLHYDWMHLATNTLFMLFFGVWLEILLGEGIFLGAFVVPALFANLVTAEVFAGLALFDVYPEATRFAADCRDIGASLGIFGTLGALLPFLRKSRLIAVLAIAGIAGYAYSKDHWLHLNHIVAVMLGWMVLKIILWAKRRVFSPGSLEL